MTQKPPPNPSPREEEQPEEKPAWVGEHGPELTIPVSARTVHNVQQRGRKIE